MIDALLNKEQKRLREEMRDFVRWVPKQLLLDMDADKVRYPREFLQEAARRNLLGLRFPKEHGGRGLTWRDEIVALQEVGALGASLSCLYSLVSIVGEALHVFGTDAQKKKYLVPLLKGELTCGEALTEPRGGSDFFGAAAVARPSGDHYVLNGQKRFMVGAEGADFCVVYAKTAPSASRRRPLSVFIVDRDDTVETKYLYGLLGTRGGGAGRVVFRDTKVPAANLLHKEKKGADVFFQMMIPERLTAAAGAVGLAQAGLDIAARYADKRHAFGQKIREFQAVSFKLAEGVTKLDASRGLVHAAACAADDLGCTGVTRRLVSEAKRFSTDSAWQVTDAAMQVLGGIGYTNVFPVERMLRDARLMTIWTGTNEIMNLIIQHEYFKEVLAGDGGRDVEDDAEQARAEGEKIYE